MRFLHGFQRNVVPLTLRSKVLPLERTITKKHRLAYEVFEMEVHVDVLSAYVHYDDK